MAKEILLTVHINPLTASCMLGGLAKKYKETANCNLPVSVIEDIKNTICNILLQLYHKGINVLSSSNQFYSYTRLVGFDTKYIVNHNVCKQC